MTVLGAARNRLNLLVKMDRSGVRQHVIMVLAKVAQALGPKAANELINEYELDRRFQIKRR